MAFGRRYGIGPVPDGLDPGLDTFLQDVHRLLLDLGAGAFGAGGYGGYGGGINVYPGPPGPVGPPGDDSVYVPDLTPPPTPTGCEVSAGIDFVFIETDPPIFTMGHGYGRTVVYGVTYPGTGPLPTFSNAVVVHEFTGQVGSFGSNPATEWHIWVKWMTRDGVLSVSPAGGANGFVATTAQDVTLLLEALTHKITELQLYQDLADRIDLIDTNAVGSVNARIAAETQARIDAVEGEAYARSQEIASEAELAADNLLDEVNARIGAVSNLQTQIDTLEAASSGDLGPVLAAIQAEGVARADADSAEAALRLALATQIRGSYSGTDLTQLTTGLLYSEREARVSEDSAIASDISALEATVQGNYNTLSGLITDEETARADADSAEVSARQTLATQLRGSYTGGDLGALSAGLLYDERIARVSQDEALAQEITLLSAGSGQQFDYQTIWYFDSGVEGWTALDAGETSANVLASNAQGWLRMVSASGSVSDAQVASPTFTAIAGATYHEIRARIRKYGTPTWEGNVYFLRTGDTPWVLGNLATISEPTFDVNGIAVVSWDMPSTWTATTIIRIRIDLAAATTTTDYFDIDWVAIGRPAPGASSADILTESQARAAADAAEVTYRQALSVKLTGLPDPAGTGLAALTSGLIFDERSARATADTSEVILRQSLSSKLTGLADPAGATLATLTAGLLYDERVARSTQDGALASSISNLQATVTQGDNTLQGAIQSEQIARASGDSANASSIQSLQSTITNPTTGLAATYAAVQTEASTRAGQDGVLFAKYTVKIDVNGYVSGFGLASTANNAAPYSAFLIRADSFAVCAPSGPGITPAVPFIVQTTPTVENGVAVPVGVYMDGAYIKNLNAAIAKLGNAWVTDAKIVSLSATKLTAGIISVGDYIQSSNYVAGFSGWRIHGNGSAEFSAASIRGQLVASQIAASSITTDKLAAGAITTDKLAAGAITADKIAARTIVTDRLLVGSVSAPFSVAYAGQMEAINMFAAGVSTDAIPITMTNAWVWQGGRVITAFNFRFLFNIGSASVAAWRQLS